MPNETAEQFEERVRNKRSNVLLRYLSNQLEDEDDGVTLSIIVANNNRKQVSPGPTGNVHLFPHTLFTLSKPSGGTKVLLPAGVEEAAGDRTVPGCGRGVRGDHSDAGSPIRGSTSILRLIKEHIQLVQSDLPQSDDYLSHITVKPMWPSFPQPRRIRSNIRSCTIVYHILNSTHRLTNWAGDTDAHFLPQSNKPEKHLDTIHI